MAQKTLLLKKYVVVLFCSYEEITFIESDLEYDVNRNKHLGMTKDEHEYVPAHMYLGMTEDEHGYVLPLNERK